MIKAPIKLSKAQTTMLRRVCAFKLNPIVVSINYNTLKLDVHDMFLERIDIRTLTVLIRLQVISYSDQFNRFIPTKLGTKLANLGRGNPATILGIRSSLEKTHFFLNKNNAIKMK